MMRWLNCTRIAILGAAAILAGCVVPPARDPVDKLGDVGAGETIVVGRIELVPPLRKDEKQIKALNSGSFANKMYMITDGRYRQLQDEPTTADFNGRIEATLGKNFFVRSSNKPFYILGGMLFLTDMNKAYFPGGVKVNILPGDKAVYIGTIQYHRDEFFNIQKVAIVDDYGRAYTEFRNKFGTRYPLRKALVTAAK